MTHAGNQLHLTCCFPVQQGVRCGKPAAYLGRWHLSHCREHQRVWWRIGSYERDMERILAAVGVRQLQAIWRVAPTWAGFFGEALDIQTCPTCGGSGAVVVRRA
jgi:hypothetical protein